MEPVTATVHKFRDNFGPPLVDAMERLEEEDPPCGRRAPEEPPPERASYYMDSLGRKYYSRMHSDESAPTDGGSSSQRFYARSGEVRDGNQLRHPVSYHLSRDHQKYQHQHAKPWYHHPHWSQRGAELPRREEAPPIQHWNEDNRGVAHPPLSPDHRKHHVQPPPSVPSKLDWGWKFQPNGKPQQQPREDQEQQREQQGDQEHRRVLVAVSNEELSPSSQKQQRKEERVDTEKSVKRSISPSPEIASAKRSKGFAGLELLVLASMEMSARSEKCSPRQSPVKSKCLTVEHRRLPVNQASVAQSGCSCPKSKCVALYCECFKAMRRCDPSSCTCMDCKNTIEESGPNGARTVAIRQLLARNPRAFTAPLGEKKPLAPGQVACNCVRSRCLKLYCTCFQSGKACQEGFCSCVGCLNTDASGDRQFAIAQALQKRPDAFNVRVKEVGLGCACKNNRCVRKYCECFRNELACTEKCSCANCENRDVATAV